MSEIIKLTSDQVDKIKAKALQHMAHSKGQDCGEEKCQECCPHYEWDHDQCMDCEKERCPGEAIDRAMDSMDMER